MAPPVARDQLRPVSACAFGGGFGYVMVQVLVPGYRDWRDRRREHAEQQIDAPRAARVTGKNGRVDSERGLFDPDQIVRIREADDFTYSGLRPVLFLFFFVGRKAIAS